MKPIDEKECRGADGRWRERLAIGLFCGVVVLGYLMPRVSSHWWLIGEWPGMWRMYFWWGMAMTAGLWVVHSVNTRWHDWLRPSFSKAGCALKTALIFALPMWVIGLMGRWSPPDSMVIWRNIFFGPLMEELFFRGFAFGALYFVFGVSFWRAALFSSLLFALGHLYQDEHWLNMSLIAAMTLAGGLWFCWLYARWRVLWLPIFLHMLMNGAWALFDLGDNALGGLWGNLGRILTIAISIWWTIAFHRKESERHI